MRVSLLKPLLKFLAAALALAPFSSPIAAQEVAPATSANGFSGTTAAPVASADVPQGLSTGDWSSIRTAYEGGRHAVQAEGDGFRAWNPGQAWDTQFDGRGFTVTPDAGAWSWGLELQSYGFPGQEKSVTRPAHTEAKASRVAYDWDETLTEWYINDTRGLEHGFTLRERPTPEDASALPGPLTLTLVVRGGLTVDVAEEGSSVRFLDGEGRTLVTYTGLKVIDAAGNGVPARFEGDGDLLRLSMEERSARYPLTIDPLAQQAYIKASNTDAGDEFGHSVSVAGDTVVVGAYKEDSGFGPFTFNQADNSVSNAGAVYVFVRDPLTGAWRQRQYIKASCPAATDLFGHSVSVSGDTLVIGAYGDSGTLSGGSGNPCIKSGAGFTGGAYVYRGHGAGWGPEAYLKASNAESGDQFGYSVSVSGDTVVIGANHESSNATGVNGNQLDNSFFGGAGAAYVFVRDPVTSNWSQQAYLKASNTDDQDQFGYSVSISGDTMVVGAEFESSDATGVNGDQANNNAKNAGAAYVFVRNPQAGSWSQQAYLKASNTDANDRFAATVSVSGDTVVIGSARESSSGIGVNGEQLNNGVPASGAAYVFVRDPLAGSWSQQAYLKASNPESGDLFGQSVSVSGDVLVVGAISEASNATGVNGNQSDNSTFRAGAAYVFARNPQTGIWKQHAYVKASNPGAFDFFGDSVAVSADMVVIGADRESSNATGVNGNQADDSASKAGAVYAFKLHLPTHLAQSTGGVLPGFGGTRSPLVSGSGSTGADDSAPALALLQDVSGASPVLRVSGARAGALGVLLLGPRPVRFGERWVVEPIAWKRTFVLSGVSGSPVEGSVDLPLTGLPASLFSASWFAQVAILDPQTGRRESLSPIVELRTRPGTLVR